MSAFETRLVWFKAADKKPKHCERVLYTKPSCDVVDFALYLDGVFTMMGEPAIDLDVELWAHIPYVPTIEEFHYAK